MVIIIALVIGIICSSLIVTAYFYRMQYQKFFRYDHLQNNLSSAENIFLVGEDTSYLKESKFSLFAGDADSVAIRRVFWGVFDIGVIKAFFQKDTLYKVFSVGNKIDSTKWAALYLADNERPMSVSGKTMIRGNAFIPESGIQAAYVNNKFYQGDKRLIIGAKHNSEKTLPALADGRLKDFKDLIDQKRSIDTTLFNNDSVKNSFLLPTRIAYYGKNIGTIHNIKLSGNIIIISDTSLTIDSTAVLNGVMIFAKSISVKSGFHGICQLFAADTIGVEKNAQFDYPSCIGLLRFKPPGLMNTQEKISLADHVQFNGLIFTYEHDKTPLLPFIGLGNKVLLKGQVYSQGILGFNDDAVIDGSVFTSVFSYQTSFTRYENYIINTTIDAQSLSPYYLSSDLLPVVTKKKKVLQWLEAN